MTTIKIPIYDLLVFLDEKENSGEKKTNILDFVKDHYKCLTGIIPKFSYECALETLCFCDSGLIKNGNFPNKEGLLLKNKNGQYGLTFSGHHIANAVPTKEDTIWVWQINEEGYLFYETYDPHNWIEWGALTALYSYCDYDEGVDKNLGERDLKRGMIGKDVLMLQQHLLHIDEDVPLSGEFEEITERAVKSVQYMHYYHSDVNGIIKKENITTFIR